MQTLLLQKPLEAMKAGSLFISAPPPGSTPASGDLFANGEQTPDFDMMGSFYYIEYFYSRVIALVITRER